MFRRRVANPEVRCDALLVLEGQPVLVLAGEEVQSVADVRFVGKAELTIDFSNFAVDAKRGSSAEEDGQ